MIDVRDGSWEAPSLASSKSCVCVGVLRENEMRRHGRHPTPALCPLPLPSFVLSRSRQSLYFDQISQPLVLYRPLVLALCAL